MGTTAELSRIHPPGNEQRLSARKRLSQPTPIELSSGNEMWVHDLGEGGLSVTGNSRLEVGTSARINFQLPETNSVIEAAGVVAWSASGRIGFRFASIEADSTAALSRWLSSDKIGRAHV